jgi:hypothetical protein
VSAQAEKIRLDSAAEINYPTDIPMLGKALRLIPLAFQPFLEFRADGYGPTTTSETLSPGTR